MQVCKWGNSLAVRIPANIISALNLKEGDDIELVHTGKSYEVLKQESREFFAESLTKFNGLLPKDYVFNRDEANER